jgi:sodium transport system permease protein
MRLNTSIVATLFRAELRMVLRDRRMLLTSLVLPLLVTPFMILASSWTIRKREQTLQHLTYRYAVTGSQAETVRALVAATRTRLADSETNQSGAGSRANTNRFHFEEASMGHPQAALNDGKLHFILDGLTSEGARQPALTPETRVAATNQVRSARARTSGGDPDEGETAMTGVPVIRIIYRADRDESAVGMSRMEQALRDTRRAQRAELLDARGFRTKPVDLAVVAEHDLASKSQLAGLALGRMLTLLLLLFILTSGAVIATDSLAGEKERGTLETLLTTSARRVEILAAKHFVVLAIALLITCIQALNLLVYVGFRLLPVPPSLVAAVPPWVAGLLLVLFLPVAALAANVLLLISGYARTYKEAQMYFMPAVLLGLLPALAPLLPGVSLRSAIVLVPVANIALASKEILIGSFDWPMILLSWVITSAAAVWTTRLGVKVLSTERLLSAAGTEAAEITGGPALFERRVVPWFAALWAVLVIVSNYTGKADLRLQIVINLVGVFFTASCLMMRRYRLAPREALALRAPRPTVWLGVLLGVPGGMLTALGLFRLTNFLLPVPQKVMESFGENVLPPGIPLAQLLFFLCVLPGIFEEIAFRGLLLHGLRRRLHPAALALVVGLVFGIFHVALFRFVPTACLGVMLAAVTMMTGSIYPAMLWHALSNAAGILAYKLQIPEAELDPLSYLTGVGILAAAFWIFWRNRTPYPGLRWRTSRLSPERASVV